MTMQVDKSIVHLLKLNKKDYLTVKQVRDGLPVTITRYLGLEKGKSPVKEVINRLQPHLGAGLKILKKGATRYIALNLSMKDIIINKIRDNPNLSSKQVRSQLPMNNHTFVEALNDLLKKGELVGILSEKTHLLKGFLVLPAAGSIRDGEQEDTQEKRLFKNAFEQVSKGRSFVRIHLIREELSWPKNRFDRVLEQLKTDLVIQLQGGDPLAFSKSEIEQSYIDSNGRLRLTVTWISND